MFLILLQIDIIVDIEDFPINAHPHIAFMANMVENLAVLALLAPHDLCHDEQLRAFRQFLYLVDHLVNRLLGDGLAALRAVRTPRPRKEQTQIVIDFRDRAHRGTRIMACGLLVNGDCRRQTVDVIHIRFIHLPQELPGIGGQRFHITPLTLGIDCIKGQRRFPRPRQARNHDQFIPRDVHIDIL